MKKILILIFALITVSINAQNPMSWGVGGVGSTDTTSLSNRIDSKADTSLIITGQEALDSLSSMIINTNYDASDAVQTSKLENGTLKAETLLPFSVNLNMADGYLRLIQLVVKNPMTIDTVNVPIGTAGVFTADNENSITIYKVNATGDSINKVLTSANDGNIFKTQGMISVPMTSSYTFNRGDIIYIGATYNNSAQTTAPAIIGIHFPSSDLLQIGYTTYMSKSSVTSTSDSYKISDLSTTSGSSTHYKFYLY